MGIMAEIAKAVESMEWMYSLFTYLAFYLIDFK
jgi:hypothetical protein